MNGRSLIILRRSIMTLVLLCVFLYLGNGFIIRLRLSLLGSKIILMDYNGEVCDSANCTANWKFRSTQRFALIGNVLRTHKIISSETGEEIFPINQVRGTTADSWTRLHVYAIHPGKNYILKATRPSAALLGYFVGVLPRSSDSEGILSIPDIAPTTALISGVFLVALLGFMFSAAFLGSKHQAASLHSERKKLIILAVSAGFASFGAFIGLGIVDTLLPEGDVRNKLLRVSGIIALSLPTLLQIPKISSHHFILKITSAIAVVTSLSLLLWPWIRGGPTFGILLAILVITGTASIYKMGQHTAAFLWLTALIDPMRILGWINFYDYPPIYFNNVVTFASFILASGNLGAFATIELASLAYRRFNRELVLRGIQNRVEDSSTVDSTAKILGLRNELKEISSITGAGQVTISVNLQLGRPVTLKYENAADETTIFDDGRIAGAVTLRTLLYGDEAMFESFEEFASRLRIQKNPNFQESKYFCAVALRVNQTIMGTLILTKFNDAAVQRLKEADPVGYMTEERETIHLVAERLSASLSKLTVHSMNETADLSRNLQIEIHRAIAMTNDSHAFLMSFADAISRVCGLQIILHERENDKAIACAQSGLEAEDWLFFVENPLNLKQSSLPSFGPTVVAFRDLKSSYVKDVTAIWDSLHPKTKSILINMQAHSMIAVPLETLHRSFVVTAISTGTQSPANSALLSVIEATESLFVAAVEVMSQKVSVLALGQIANRLVADEDVQAKILYAARMQSLPTVVGSVKRSFILLHDLAGSSDLSGNEEEKADAYGKFYNAINQKSSERLGGKVRKTIGDAVLVTWDGATVDLGNISNFLNILKELAAHADEVGKMIGCTGARSVLHYGSYFFGLVGTQTFGQIDVIGSAINEICKMEQAMKELYIDGNPLRLALSSTAAFNLTQLTAEDYSKSGIVGLSLITGGKFLLQYGTANVHLVEDCDAA